MIDGADRAQASARPNAELEAAPAPVETPRRRPYVAPRLRRLGSVRDLTYGGSAGLAEGAGTFRGRM